jgi:hypothetical protein
MADDTTTPQKAINSDVMTALRDKLSDLYHLTVDIGDKTKKEKQLKAELLQIIKANGLEKNKFGVADKYVRYVSQNVSEGLSQKFLLKSLQEYPEFATNKSKANDIYNFILNKRTSKLTESIKVVDR